MSWIFEQGRTRHNVRILARHPLLRFEAMENELAVGEGANGGGAFSLEVDGQRVDGWRYVSGADVFVRLNGQTFAFRRVGPEAGDTQGAGGGNEIRAEMPGTVVAIQAALGKDVEEGDPLLTIESMKLQISIVAHRAGRISGVHVAENATFDRGALLVSLAALPEGGA